MDTISCAYDGYFPNKKYANHSDQLFGMRFGLNGSVGQGIDTAG